MGFLLPYYIYIYFIKYIYIFNKKHCATAEVSFVEVMAMPTFRHDVLYVKRKCFSIIVTLLHLSVLPEPIRFGRSSPMTGVVSWVCCEPL